MLRRSTLVALLTLSLSFGAHAAADKASTELRVLLQVAMQTHIDRITVAGRYPVVDLKSGAVRSLHPAATHPMVLRMGEYYVLCADFRDDAGQPVNVDFYVAKGDKRFTVFQVEVANRAPLDSLMKAGVVRMLE